MTVVHIYTKTHTSCMHIPDRLQSSPFPSCKTYISQWGRESNTQDDIGSTYNLGRPEPSQIDHTWILATVTFKILERYFIKVNHGIETQNIVLSSEILKKAFLASLGHIKHAIIQNLSSKMLVIEMGVKGPKCLSEVHTCRMGP